MSSLLANLNDELAESLQKVRRRIEDLVAESPGMIRKDLETLTARPGKMLRPLFVFLSARGGEAVEEELVSIAASMELLHIASLAHDDVIDNAARRRGELTLHQTSGAKRAILAGDYLLAMSMKLASGRFEQSLVARMTEGVERLCLSEIEQDENIGRFNVSREQYYSRIQGKTAELFGLSCFAGALLSGKNEEGCEQLYQAGLNFGMAFQIQDDVLDYLGDSGVMGKNGNTDIKNGIPTLPLILAMEDKLPGVEALLVKGLRFLFAPLVIRKIVKGGYHIKAEEIASDFLGKSLESAESSLDKEGFAQFSRVLDFLKDRIH